MVFLFCSSCGAVFRVSASLYLFSCFEVSFRDEAGEVYFSTVVQTKAYATCEVVGVEAFGVKFSLYIFEVVLMENLPSIEKVVR